MSSPQLLTVGHGRLGRDELSTLLHGAAVSSLVDIRRFPGSRHNPDVSTEEMANWLPAAGIAYRWDARLGGRRKLPADSPDSWWKVDSFRAYAAHTRTPEFGAGMADLLAEVKTQLTAVMCSEAVWWRCHRRLVADVVLVGFQTQVRHLMPNGDLRDHLPSEGARRISEGQLVWDASQP